MIINKDFFMKFGAFLVILYLLFLKFSAESVELSNERIAIGFLNGEKRAKARYLEVQESCLIPRYDPLNIDCIIYDNVNKIIREAHHEVRSRYEKAAIPVLEEKQKQK